MSHQSPSLLRNKTKTFEEEWTAIRPVVLKFLKQEGVTKEEWQDLFWFVYTLCSWGAEKCVLPLQEALLREITDYIRDAYDRVKENREENALLNAYISEWKKFYIQTLYLPEPFRPLETGLYNANASGAASTTRSPQLFQRAVQQSSTSAIPVSGPQAGVIGGSRRNTTEDSVVRRMMLDIWNRMIFSSIKERLQAAAMKLILAERNGEGFFDGQLVVGVRESYVSLCTDAADRFQIYRQNFEAAYFEATDEFYRGSASKYLDDNGVLMYMNYVDSKLNEEEQRGMRYLETSVGCNSVQQLMERLVESLVTSFQEQILGECLTMIRSENINKLRLMYRLLNRTTSGIMPMCKILESHIKSEGLADMKTNAESITTDPEKYVERLLDMFSRFSDLVRDAFCNDPRFLTSRDKAFQEVVNDTSVFRLDIAQTKQKGPLSKTQPESKCPELLANYCDLLLRKTPLSRKLTSDEVDKKLQEVLLVLKYIQSKDVFVRYYKSHLARRLILDVSADQEKEESMVQRLREAGMPAEYINKFLRMLQDIEINKDLNKAFKAAHTLSNNNRNAIADIVNIKVLNAGAWSRVTERVAVSLPRELEDFIPEVDEFYRAHHSGRRLQWQHHWSNGIVQFSNDDGGRYELEVTTFQMVVLFCWNDRPHDQISYENLRLATALPDIELRKTLWSLVAAPKFKHQVLLCDLESKNPKDFTPITLFWPNHQFAIVKNGKSQKRGRLNLIGRLQLSVEQSKEQEHDEIVQLRVWRIQESIVKIMKMRKRLNNGQLQTELVEMLKHMFLPSRKMIKEQIEWLIEQKYLIRDEEDINVFVYVA